jgi:hypothetical protein
MNEEKPVQTNRRWGLIASSCLGVFILGFILGLLFDAHFRPNYITLELDRQSNQIKVRPRKNDVVNWVERPASGAPGKLDIAYLTDSPCVNDPNHTDKSICTVAVDGGQYTYLCSDSSGPVPCDPGNDPQPNNDTYVKKTTLGSVDVALGKDPGAGLPTPAAASPAAAAAAPGAPHMATVLAGITCDASNTPVVRSSTDTSTAPITMRATEGQIIQWAAGQKEFTVSHFALTAGGPDITICNETTIDNNNSVCTVNASTLPTGTTSIQYKVGTPGPDGACSNQPGTAYLSVTKH